MTTRRVRLSVAMSLDGFIATPDGGYDWIPMDPEIDFAEMFSEFDTVLMGRKSYEAAQAQGQVGMPGMKAIVFSRSLRAEDHPDVTVSRSPVETVRLLRAQPGGALRTRLALVSHRLYRTTGTMLFTYSVEGAALGSA